MKKALQLAALVAVAFLIAWLVYSCRRPPFSWVVDPTQKSFGPTAPTVAGATPKEYVLGPNGITYQFAGDRMVVRPKDAADLSRILATYKGSVLYDGSAQPAKAEKPAVPSGTWLIRVDASGVATKDLTASLKSSGLYGRYTFSSLNGVRMVALAAREMAAGASVGLDPSFHPGEVWNTTQVLEGNDPDTGVQLNYANEPYATATLNLANSQLGIGVVRAWDYLEYKGIPFGSTWTVPTLVIIDGGFAVDTHTGAPLNGNPDFHENTTPVQWSETTGGNRTNAGGSNPSSCSGGSGCPWHGTETYSVAAAYPGNNFGSAGSGGMIPSTAIVKIDDTDGFEIAMGILDAARLEPEPAVMNISSYSGPCGYKDPSFCGYFYANTFGSIGDAVNFARGYSNTTVVSIAGNDSEYDNEKYDDVPCTLPGVLCVGAINFNGTLETDYVTGTSGYGPRVAIFAPDGEWTTPNPSTNGKISRDWGTSASAPFVSGIITLMKALNPSLTPDQVLGILQATALKSTDPKVKVGYVNALAAVQAVSPNLPPTIKITQPAPNSTFGYNSSLTFGSHVSDPEQPGGVAGLTIQWKSSIDGNICTGIVCDSAIVLSVGQHTITATITDPFGATASASMPLRVIKPFPPTATIVLPANNSTFSASQQVHLVGAGESSDSPPFGASQLAWTSSVAGSLGTGSDIWVSLPDGSETITLTATDNFGQGGTATVNITLQSGSQLPTVKITSPPYNSALATGQAGTFIGSATDPFDVTLSGAQLQWTDNLDGYLGQGAKIVKVLSAPSCGPIAHQVTLTGTDSKGNKATSTVIVAVGPIC
jgi:serine protease